MKAMILAAGRGERLRPITDHTPKPLIKVNGIPLIEHHIIKLAAAGFAEIVINLAWLGEKIEQYLQDGSRWGVNIRYSREKPHALETAGGIIHALPLLVEQQLENWHDEEFLVINGDIYLDYDFSALPGLTGTALANLWLVPNPEHNQQGDFDLVDDYVSPISSQQSYTFSGVGLYKARFFTQLVENTVRKDNEIIKLGPSLKEYAKQGVIKGKLLNNFWTDVGTAERLAQVNEHVGVKK